MKPDGESFCVLPWVHMNLNPDGAMTLCCQSHTAIENRPQEPLNAQAHTIPSMWNSEGMKDVRRRMSAGERLPHCAACFNNEHYGRVSYRMVSNDRWLNNHPRASDIRLAIEQSSD